MSESVVAFAEVRRYMVDCMRSVGTAQSHAEQLADVLIAGDSRGHYSHGLNRLDMYVHDVETGMVAKDGEPKLIQEKGATGWVDGGNLLGPVVGNFCTEVAMRKAKEVGIGWVAAKNSNHFGIAGYYPLKMLDNGLIGMAFTNTSPIVFPTRSGAGGLGTNPISLAAPGLKGDDFVLDMATSTVAIGKVELAGRKGQEIPQGWAVDKGGHETTKPAEVVPTGGLYPLGGGEASGGYKGYGLAMLVEVFCGILSGSHYGPNIRRWMATDRVADLGQCFVAIDPTAFAPGFEPRMADLISLMRSLPRVNEEEPVLVAGDPERAHLSECEAKRGIPYHPNQIAHAAELAKRLGVQPMKTL